MSCLNTGGILKGADNQFLWWTFSLVQWIIYSSQCRIMDSWGRKHCETFIITKFHSQLSYIHNRRCEQWVWQRFMSVHFTRCFFAWNFFTSQEALNMERIDTVIVSNTYGTHRSIILGTANKMTRQYRLFHYTAWHTVFLVTLKHSLKTQWYWNCKKDVWICHSISWYFDFDKDLTTCSGQ